jgi:hypothetical protein
VFNDRVGAIDRREEIADAFALRASAVPGVRQVRFTTAGSDLLVTVLTEDRDMERDRRLRAIFIEDTAALKNAPDLQILVRASPERSS